MMQSEFFLTGISVRTSNKNSQSQTDIGSLWTRFKSESLINKITEKTSDDLYCVYTEYETDHTGFYTAILGCKVRSLSFISEKFTGILVPGGKYQVYTPTGRFPENIGEAWQQIWKNDVKRAYKADYDIYSANPKSFEETEVKIYVGVY